MPDVPVPPRELETSALPGSLDELHALLDEVWRDAPDTTDRDRMAFTTALAEVAANVVEHAARFEPVRLRLVVHVRPDRLEAHVEDRGHPYRASAPAADELAESGRGLAMARALVDEVLYERDGPVNRWVVSLHRGR